MYSQPRIFLIHTTVSQDPMVLYATLSSRCLSTRNRPSGQFQRLYSTRIVRQDPSSPLTFEEKECMKPRDRSELLLLFLKEVRYICALVKQVKFVWSINLTCIAVVVYMGIKRSTKKTVI